MHDEKSYGEHKKAIRQAVELLRHVVTQAISATSDDADFHSDSMDEQVENTPRYEVSRYLRDVAVKDSRYFRDLRNDVDNILKGLK